MWDFIHGGDQENQCRALQDPRTSTCGELFEFVRPNEARLEWEFWQRRACECPLRAGAVKGGECGFQYFMLSMQALPSGDRFA